jgi:hypothetical protein
VWLPLTPLHGTPALKVRMLRGANPLYQQSAGFFLDGANAALTKVLNSLVLHGQVSLLPIMHQTNNASNTQPAVQALNNAKKIKKKTNNTHTPSLHNL